MPKLLFTFISQIESKADFGLGKLAISLLGAGRTTMNAGSPAFQPPEQLKGEMVDTVQCICSRMHHC